MFRLISVALTALALSVAISPAAMAMASACQGFNTMYGDLNLHYVDPAVVARGKASPAEQAATAADAAIMEEARQRAADAASTTGCNKDKYNAASPVVVAASNRICARLSGGCPSIIKG